MKQPHDSNSFRAVAIYVTMCDCDKSALPPPAFPVFAHRELDAWTSLESFPMYPVGFAAVPVTDIHDDVIQSFYSQMSGWTVDDCERFVYQQLYTHHRLLLSSTRREFEAWAAKTVDFEAKWTIMKMYMYAVLMHAHMTLLSSGDDEDRRDDFVRQLRQQTTSLVMLVEDRCAAVVDSGDDRDRARAAAETVWQVARVCGAWSVWNAAAPYAGRPAALDGSQSVVADVAREDVVCPGVFVQAMWNMGTVLLTGSMWSQAIWPWVDACLRNETAADREVDRVPTQLVQMARQCELDDGVWSDVRHTHLSMTLWPMLCAACADRAAGTTGRGGRRWLSMVFHAFLMPQYASDPEMHTSAMEATHAEKRLELEVKFASMMEKLGSGDAGDAAERVAGAVDGSTEPRESWSPVHRALCVMSRLHRYVPADDRAVAWRALPRRGAAAVMWNGSLLTRAEKCVAECKLDKVFLDRLAFDWSVPLQDLCWMLRMWSVDRLSPAICSFLVHYESSLAEHNWIVSPVEASSCVSTTRGSVDRGEFLGKFQTAVWDTLDLMDRRKRLEQHTRTGYVHLNMVRHDDVWMFRWCCYMFSEMVVAQQRRGQKRCELLSGVTVMESWTYPVSSWWGESGVDAFGPEGHLWDCDAVHCLSALVRMRKHVAKAQLNMPSDPQCSNEFGVVMDTHTVVTELYRREIVWIQRQLFKCEFTASMRSSYRSWKVMFQVCPSELVWRALVHRAVWSSATWPDLSGWLQHRARVMDAWRAQKPRAAMPAWTRLTRGAFEWVNMARYVLPSVLSELSESDSVSWEDRVQHVRDELTRVGRLGVPSPPRRFHRRRKNAATHGAFMRRLACMIHDVHMPFKLSLEDEME